MNYYEKLNINNFAGYNVIIGLNDGTSYKGLLDIDLVNEDWQEDNEKEALALEIDGNLTQFDMDTIKFIRKIVKVKYMGIDDPLALRHGKIYDATLSQKGWYGIIDETGGEYAYPPELFEVFGEAGE